MRTGTPRQPGVRAGWRSLARLVSAVARARNRAPRARGAREKNVIAVTAKQATSVRTAPKFSRMAAAAADVAIVGGGASGSLVAIQLLRQARSPLSIVLVERGERPGRGIAYSTSEPDHLLNVPASKMSALPDVPDHFASWARTADDAFVARGRYGEYLEQTLRECVARAARGVSFEIRRATATSMGLVDGVLRLNLLPDGPLDARTAILAMGNFPTIDLAVDDGGLYASDRYARSPFLAGALDGIETDADVVFLGSGLTMVDAALALRARGHRGRLHAISRHGLVPQVHGPVRPSRARIGAIGVRGLLRAFRTEIERGGDWRAAFDAFRASTQRIWLRLPLAERERFLRHLRPYWDVHRHRMAPPVGQAIAALRASGQLSIRAGRIASFALQEDAALVRFRPRGSRAIVEISCARVINCTGPAIRIEEARSSLVSSLLSSGLARPGCLGMGFATNADGALLGNSGGRLFGLGSLRRGDLWESTAVPELREQARALAARIVSRPVRQAEPIRASS